MEDDVLQPIAARIEAMRFVVKVESEVAELAQHKIRGEIWVQLQGLGLRRGALEIGKAKKMIDVFIDRIRLEIELIIEDKGIRQGFSIKRGT